MNIATYSYDFFKKVNNAHNSRSEKETALYNIRETIAGTYQETVDYQPDTLVDGNPVPLIVMEYHGNTLDKNRMKKIEAPPGSHFNLGSKVDCFGLKWLVTDINYNQELKLAGHIQLCNYLLRFQDSSGNILEEECVEKTYQVTSTGLDENKVVTNNDTIKHVLVQYNSEVLNLHQGKRLFIDMAGVPDPKVYEITNINRTTYMYGGYGFFDVTCTETERRSADRPDLMIADYINPLYHSSAPIGFCEIRYSGDPIIKAGGSAKTFTAVFTGSNGNIINSIIPTWQLILPIELQDYNKIAILSQIGSDIRIQASEFADIGKTFSLKVTATDLVYGYFEKEIILEVGGIF